MSDRYDEPRAHVLRERYHAAFGGDELPVPEEIGVDPEAKALEREANIFAANLVMPELAVRAAGGENRFGVSDEALAWRLYNLGLVEEKPR